jgi:hypothetical protein
MQEAVHSRKGDILNISKSPLTAIKTTNRSEDLLNLDREQTKQTNTIMKKIHESNTSHEQKVEKSTTLRANGPKDKEEPWPVPKIPVLVNGCVPCNTPIKAPVREICSKQQ